MKIVVFSDSHGDVNDMETVIFTERPDAVIHLGDRESDCDALAPSAVPVYRVCGNCDFGDCCPAEELFVFAGKRIFGAHGHRYGVKYSTDAIIARAVSLKADAVLFGHTHIPLCERQGELFVMNPGSLRDSGTYGVLTVENGRMNAENRLL